jgi:poly-gamma-glutamate capsule biosynthesis protein CapA/YwtB (metallophosphatase superfamily)
VTVCAVAAAVLLAGCTAPAAGRAPVPSAPTASANSLPAPSPSGAGDITLAFAGDVHFSERTAKLLATDPSTAFGPVAQVLSGADVAMVNLETAVTDGGTPEPKQFHFRAPASAFDAVRAAGVDVVTIANNHSMDYGRGGLADTLDNAQRAKVPAIGAGRNAAEAYAPWVTTVRGTRIAYLAFSQIHELEYSWAARDDRPGIAMAVEVARAAAAVSAARQIADVVVVYLHWGFEGNNCPVAEMKTFASAMSAAGANVVLGTHAHLLLGDGWLGKTYVNYGLGNFLWWRDDAYSNDTGVLKLTVRDKAVVGAQFVPALISRTTGQPIPASGAQGERITRKVADLRRCTGLADSP